MLQQTSQGINLAIKVTPKANRNEVIGIKNDELCLRIAAVPEKGDANAELISFLSKLLGIGKTNITLISGKKSRHKKVCISNISIHDLEMKLNHSMSS
jgi:uncharacterized protein